MSTNVLRLGTDGRLPGIRVVGFHGKVGTEQTPARRGPVLADEHGRLVRVLEGERSPREVLVEIDAEPLPEGELPGIGTRLSSVPALFGDRVVIVGDRERRSSWRLTPQTSETSTPCVEEFVAWLGGTEPRSERLRCERVDDVVAWVCSPDEAFALWKRIEAVAEEELVRALGRDKQSLVNASFWLSRASVAERSMYLAAAGLSRAGSPHVEALLRAGLRNRTEEERRRGVEEAAAVLEKHSGTKNASPPGPVCTSFRDRMRKRSLVRAA
ncbi:hypothetical protein [Polyangium sorediatum]|uniref:HEAT repeat domain-containing protein n=1 Tax=Polyangium sorediatum TaxID=889274 RepID=A0ABT6NRJ0_9BACT|nr:hypothetical protein [Polyangium sorediatum]MDI1430891.1 hypothetical protein [Polyangium sorediatum]